MGRYLSWLGVLAGAISLFRLLHLAIAFDLSRPARIVLDFYITFFHPVADFFKPIVAPAVLALAHAWGLTDLPEWWREVFVVYALIGAALFRHSLEHPDAVDMERNPFRSRARKARLEDDRERRRWERDSGDLSDGRVEDEVTERASSLSLGALATAALFAVLWPVFPFFLFATGLVSAVLFLRRAAYVEARIRREQAFRQARETGKPVVEEDDPDLPDPYRETTRWLNTHLFLWSLEMLKVVAATIVFVIANAAAGS